MNEPVKCPQCGRSLPPGALEGLCPVCLLQEGAATESATGGESQAFVPLLVAEVARLFPQLEILELIGRGGMGAVYKARQPGLERTVALKILPPGRPGASNSSERFNREAKALARLSHPNIVAVHEFGQVGDFRYLVMEYVDGVNLRQLERTDRLSPRQALAIIPQICDALQYAHDEGVVHRDIKPENVLLDRKGRVKIADFGLAKMLGSAPGAGRLTGEGQVMGTPHYMAPEQVEHPLEVDHRADIYALGVVFYEMLTGELPLGKFSPPSRKVQVDVRLDDVVLRSLEKEPERRYQQAAQVKTAVETIASAPAVAAQAEKAGDFWRRMQYRIWPPLVGLRGGQRVVNWPAVMIRGARVLLAAVWIGVFLAVMFGLQFGGKAGFLAGAAGCLFLTVVGPVILTLRVLRGWAAPTELLPVLDNLPTASTSRPQPTARGPRQVGSALVAGSSVALTVLALVAAVTLAVLPRTYMSAARVRIEKADPRSQNAPQLNGSRFDFDPYFIQTEGEIIWSQSVLEPVVENLGLQRRWAERYGAAQEMTRSEVMRLLRASLEVRPTRNTTLLEIRCYSEDAREAADLANAIAEGYQTHRTPSRVEIVDRAEPGARPVRPNVPANLAVGALCGLILGLMTAAVTFWLGHRLSGQNESDGGKGKSPLWAKGIAFALLALGALALLTPFWHFAPEQRNTVVAGTVIDAATGEPIADARVCDNRYGAAPNRLPQETWTDTQGRFELATSYEEHTIAASAPGFEPRFRTLLTKNFRREPRVGMDFQLERSRQQAEQAQGSAK